MVSTAWGYGDHPQPEPGDTQTAARDGTICAQRHRVITSEPADRNLAFGVPLRLVRKSAAAEYPLVSTLRRRSVAKLGPSQVLP
jgi:hypothetical protein